MIFERYGVPYEGVSDMVPCQNDWDGGLRVYPRVRLCVRCNCHICDSTFRHERACCQCSYKRCDACRRVLPHRRAMELRACLNFPFVAVG